MAELYAVILPKADDTVKHGLLAGYPHDDVHEVAPNVFLVHTLLGANDILAKAGIVYEPDGVTTPGVVFSLNGSYSGVYRRALWDWMDTPSTGARSPSDA